MTYPTPADRMAATNVIIGQHLRNIREQRRWPQGYVGQELGITSQQVSKYERGENMVSAAMLLAFAKVLEVDVLVLLEGCL